MKLQHLEVDFQNYIIKGDKFKGHCNTVVLHGAGNSSCGKFLRLRQKLNTKGLPSVSFDFIGHGTTGGKMSDMTLHLREKQALKVIMSHAENASTLIGFSMSAYTAIGLTKRLPIENLVLMVPGIYTSKAYNVNFGSEFSKIIRVKNSWYESDAFEILKEFTGNVLIIAAENDRVIPVEIVKMLYKSSSKAKTRQLHFIPSAEHLNLFPKKQDFELAISMIQQITVNNNG